MQCVGNCPTPQNNLLTLDPSTIRIYAPDNDSPCGYHDMSRGTCVHLFASAPYQEGQSGKGNSRYTRDYISLEYDDEIENRVWKDW